MNGASTVLTHWWRPRPPRGPGEEPPMAEHNLVPSSKTSAHVIACCYPMTMENLACTSMHETGVGRPLCDSPRWLRLHLILKNDRAI